MKSLALRHQGRVRIWQRTIFRKVEYRGPKKDWLLYEIKFSEYFVPISKFIIDICVSRGEIRD